jgi:Methyltransferase domain
VRHATQNRALFGELQFDVDDLLLLEPFQILRLPGRLEQADVGELVRAHPHLGRYLRRACPSMAQWLVDAAAMPPTGEAIDACEERVLWELADLNACNKAPHAYDALPHHDWDFEAITSVASLAGAVAIEVGAGTGRATVELARRARSVFAVEPGSRLRSFLRERAKTRKRHNLYVVDGTPDAVPLPSAFADVVVSVRSLGFALAAELTELERVLRPGGTIVFCAGWRHDQAEDRAEHRTLVSPRWGFIHAPYEGAEGRLSRYHKQR